MFALSWKSYLQNWFINPESMIQLSLKTKATAGNIFFLDMVLLPLNSNLTVPAKYSFL